MGNPYRDLPHDGSLVDDVRAQKYFIMASTVAIFQMPIGDPSLLTTLAFCWWYGESNTTKSKYDLYYTRLMCIHRHYAKATVKTKASKIAGFKEYLKNLPYLRQSREVSSSKGEEQEEVPEDEAVVTVTQQVGEGERYTRGRFR